MYVPVYVHLYVGVKRGQRDLLTGQQRGHALHTAHGMREQPILIQIIVSVIV